MSRGLARSLAATALTLATASVAHAGSVYVPLAKDVTVDGIRYQTQIWVSNKGEVARRFSTFFIPTDTNGTQRTAGAETGPSITVPGSTTFQLTGIAPTATNGMLEVSGAPQVLVQAKLVPFVNGVERLGAAIPVVSSDNLLLAGTQSHLQNLERSTTRQTDFVLVNLAQDAASCSVAPFRADGSAIGNAAVVSMLPLSHKQFTDVLGALGETQASAARLVITCDRNYFTYALSFNKTTGDATVQGPSEDLDSGLIRPGEDDGGNGEPNECSAGVAFCKQELGVFHEPSRGNLVRRLVYTPPPGSYSKLRLRLKVFHGGWQSPSSGLHSVFWLVRNRNFDMYGYSNWKGPGQNTVLFRHGFNQTATQKAKIETGVQVNPGETYSIDFVFDPVNRILEQKIFNAAGAQIHQLSDRPNVNRVNIEPGDTIVLDFGFTGDNPNEPPTRGWRYSDLTLEVFN
jgi:hypothetical protein